MAPVDVIILHPTPGPAAGPFEAALAEARLGLAERHRTGFLAAGATRVEIVAGPPDRRPFGARLRELRGRMAPGRGLVLLGSGAVPLATLEDLRLLVTGAALDEPRALANNRYSADVVAVSAGAASALDGLPDAFPVDNALPRWLTEVAGIPLGDLRGRWRLAMDLDSPLDAIVAARARLSTGVRVPAALETAADRLEAPLSGVAGVVTDRRAELVVAGRTSITTLAWLQRHARCRVRALVEERGLRASSRLALDDPASAPHRGPRSSLGLLLDRDGPAALGPRLAELGDAAIVDTRVLLAHRLGADETRWPAAESRYASDLLDPDRVDDPWLAELTTAAAGAAIPVLLGGHSLVGPGIRLIGSRTRA